RRADAHLSHRGRARVPRSRGHRRRGDRAHRGRPVHERLRACPQAADGVSGAGRASLGRRVVAEAVGTAFLLAAVVGSGITGERPAGGKRGVALRANPLPPGPALVSLILPFGPISGPPFTPAVTLADAAQGGLAWPDVPAYVAAQITGAFAGVAAAHLMF